MHFYDYVHLVKLLRNDLLSSTRKLHFTKEEYSHVGHNGCDFTMCDLEPYKKLYNLTDADLDPKDTMEWEPVKKMMMLSDEFQKSEDIKVPN